MNIIFYARADDRAGDRLQTLIQTQGQGATLGIYHTLNALSERLHQPMHDVKAAVLLVNHREDLTKLISFRHLLHDIRTVLILPDREAGTLALAHQLRPRFLSDISSDFLEVVAVINRMLGGHGNDNHDQTG